MLSATQRAAISMVKLPGQDMHLIHPLDTHSIKQFTGMHNLSLMKVFRVAIGPSMGLVSESKKSLTDPDTGTFKKALSRLFNEELRSLHNLRKNATHLEREIDNHWDEIVNEMDEVTIGLGSWVFDFLARSMGAAFWGEDGPFQDVIFRQRLR